LTLQGTNKDKVDCFFFPGYPSGDGARISGDNQSFQSQQPVNIFTPNFAQPSTPTALMNNPGKSESIQVLKLKRSSSTLLYYSSSAFTAPTVG
jgi:hypothetical protein